MQPIAPQTSQGLSADVVWLCLLHSVWLGLAVAGGVALALQGRRVGSHRFRYAMLLVSLSLVACGAPALAVVQRSNALSPHDVSIRLARAVVHSGPSDSLPVASRHAPNESPRAEVSASARVLQSMADAIDRAATMVRGARAVFLTAWSLVVLGCGAVLAVGARRVSRFRREGTPAPTAVQERARELGRRLRLRNVPEVRLHSRVSQPCLCGALRPVILLPDHWFATVGGGLLDAVLAHELAHARRLDHLVNLGQRFIEVLYFFHPAVHWLSRSLRRHREHCADALAVRITGDPLALATALECLALLRAARPSTRPIGAPLGGETFSLLPRIQELIGMTPVRTRPQFWPFATLPLAALFGLVAISAGSAQDRPSPTESVSKSDARDDSAVESVSAASTELAFPQGKSRAVANPNRLYSFEVRRLDFEGGGWRERLGGRLKPLGTEADARGWLIDRDALSTLLNHLVQRTPKLKSESAPKVTTFEGSLASICFGGDKMNASNAEVTMRELFQDRSKHLPGGLVVDLSGTFSPKGTRLSVDLRDSEIPVPPGQREEGQAGDGSTRAPAFVDDLHVISHEIPEGSSLLVSLGHHEQSVGPRSVTRERLVVITPRRVILEDEELRLKPRTNGKTAN